MTEMSLYTHFDKLLGDDYLLDAVDDEGRILVIQRRGKGVICVSTIQRNGWIQNSWYHMDGTYEETFDR